LVQKEVRLGSLFFIFAFIILLFRKKDLPNRY
jgi:hypothetical protein